MPIVAGTVAAASWAQQPMKGLGMHRDNAMCNITVSVVVQAVTVI